MSIKIVNMQAHTRDCFFVELVDENGKTILEEQGYIPLWMSGRESSDDIAFQIDNKTGLILNWTPIIEEDINDIDDEMIDLMNSITKNE